MEPSTKSYRELPVYSLGKWDSVTLVHRAVREAEAGFFRAAAMLWEAMGRDDRLPGVLDQRFAGLLGCPVEMEGQGDGRKKNAVSKELTEKFPRWFPEEDLKSLLMWGYGLGVGLAEIIWQRGARWEPKLKIWNPMFLSYRMEDRRYELATQDGIIPIEPGNGQWVLFTPYGHHRGWLSGLVRSLAIPWMVRTWAVRDWARHSEVHGIPIKLARTPAALESKDALAFFQDVANIGNETIVRAPSGSTEFDRFDLELLQAETDAHLTFKDLAEFCSTNMAVRVLGQNLTTEVKEGSHAAAKEHQKVAGHIRKNDAASLSTTLHDQVLTHWATYNHGSPDVAPYPRYQVEPPADLKERGLGLKNVGDGISALQKTGAKPDVDAILEEAGIPVTGPAEDPLELQPEEPAQDEKPKPGKAKKTEASRRKKASGFLKGQLYADDIVEDATARGVAALDVDLGKLLELVRGAESYEGLRGLLAGAYRGMDEDDFADVVRKALVLAELDGRDAVLEDL